MAVERGDSTAPIGGTSSDAPTTFEQTTLKGTTTTGNAKLVKRDATEIDVIDTNGYWSATTVEGVLDEIATLAGLDSAIQDQIDALDVRLTTAEGNITSNDTDIAANTAAITAEETARIAAVTAEETARIAEDLTLTKIDGSRAFTGNVAGITPTADTHLTRKDYVDSGDAATAAAAEDNAIAYAIALGG